MSPGWHQAIIWTNAGILLIRPLGTNFSEILIEIYSFSFKEMDSKMLSGKCRPFCLSLYVIINLRTILPKYYAHGLYFGVVVVSWYCSLFTISFRVTSLALGLSYDFPVSMNQPWGIRLIGSEEFIRIDNIAPKHNKTMCMYLWETL